MGVILPGCRQSRLYVTAGSVIAAAGFPGNLIVGGRLYNVFHVVESLLCSLVKTVSLWLLCCWVVTCCRNKALSISLNSESADRLCSPLGQLFVGLTGLKAAECLHGLKDEMYM